MAADLDGMERERLAKMVDAKNAALGRRLVKQKRALLAAVSASPKRLAEMRAQISETETGAADWRKIAEILRASSPSGVRVEPPYAWAVEMTTPEGVALGPGIRWTPFGSEGEEYEEMRKLGWGVEIFPLYRLTAK